MQHPPGILGDQWIADELAKVRPKNGTRVKVPQPPRAAEQAAPRPTPPRRLARPADQVAPRTMERMGPRPNYALALVTIAILLTLAVAGVVVATRLADTLF